MKNLYISYKQIISTIPAALFQTLTSFNFEKSGVKKYLIPISAPSSIQPLTPSIINTTYKISLEK